MLWATKIPFGATCGAIAPNPHPPEHYLQCTTMGLSPVCSWVLVTWSIRSTIPTPELGRPCSGQDRKWYCFTVLLLPDCRQKKGVLIERRDR